MDYGYVRVSTKEQNELRQLIALRDFGIDDKHIYIDKQSGKDFARTNYKKLIRKIKNGDTIVIKSIDRLGRNYDEILEQWRIITKEKQVAIEILLCFEVLGYDAAGWEWLQENPSTHHSFSKSLQKAFCAWDSNRIYTGQLQYGSVLRPF